MIRAWESAEFVIWFCGFVLQREDIIVFERGSDARAVNAVGAASSSAARSRTPAMKSEKKSDVIDFVAQPSESAWGARYWCGVESEVRAGHPSSEKVVERPWSKLKHAMASLGRRPKEIDLLHL